MGCGFSMVQGGGYDYLELFFSKVFFFPKDSVMVKSFSGAINLSLLFHNHRLLCDMNDSILFVMVWI